MAEEKVENTEEESSGSLKELISKLGDNRDKIQKYLKKYGKHIKNVVPFLLAFVQANRNADGTLKASATSLPTVKKLLAEAGLNSLAEEAVPALKSAASDSTSTLTLLGDPSKVSKKSMLAAMDSSFEELRGRIRVSSEEFASVVRSELVTMTLVPRSPKASQAVFEDAFSITKRKSRTLVNTALAQVQRTVQLSALESFGEDDFVVYVGPDDKVTRPFCKALEGKAIRRKDLGKLNNNQGLSVPLHGGGWNCRHSLIPASAAIVKQRNIPIATSADIQKANGGAKK